MPSRSAILLSMSLVGTFNIAIAAAQTPYQWSNQFASSATGWLRQGEANAAINYDDGSGMRLYVGGGFEYSSQRYDGVVRWNGGGWEPLGSPAYQQQTFRAVYSFAVYDRNPTDTEKPSLIIGGDEYFMNGDPGVHGVVKWDGTSFTAMGDGIRGTVFALTAFDDGTGPNIIAAGQFSIAGGISANNIARWNGESWTPLGNGIIRVGQPAIVRALTVFQGAQGPMLIAGGEFSTAGDVLAQNIAAWDGSQWHSLDGGIEAIAGDATVNALATYDDGSGTALFVGGRFSHAGQVPASNIARWSGASWSELSGGTDAPVKAFNIFQDGPRGVLCVGGTFVLAGGLSAKRIAKWDGTTWGTFGDGIPSINQPPGYVNAIAHVDIGKTSKLFAAGYFNDNSNMGRTSAVTWNGQQWTLLGQVGAPLNNSVNALLEWDTDGPGPLPSSLLAGGFFFRSGTANLNRLATWTGSSWETFEGGLAGGIFFGPVAFCLIKFDEDGPGPEPECLYVGGDFTSAGGVPARGVAKWNPISRQWSGYGTGLVIRDQVYSLAFYDDGTGPALYAGGYMGLFYLNGNSHSIARWNKALGQWEQVGGGIFERIGSIKSYPGGADKRGVLIASGMFQQAGGVEAYGIAQWNGHDWSPLGKGLENGMAYALSVGEERTGPVLYAGGTFRQAGGKPAPYLAKWDGKEWSGFPDLESYPSSFTRIEGILPFDDGTGPALYITGRFRARLNPGSLNYAEGFAKWTGTSWQSVGIGLNYRAPLSGTLNLRTPIIALDDACGKSLYVGGGFSAAGGVPSPFIATLKRQQLTVSVSPLNPRVEIGATLVIRAEATGCGSLEYQWRRYATPLQDSKRVSGVTGPELRIEHVTPADAGTYDVVILDSTGRASSNTVEVTIATGAIMLMPFPQGATSATGE